MRQLMAKRNRERFVTSQQPDLIAAVKLQAERDGQTYSEWAGDCFFVFLDDDLAATVAARPGIGRPKNTDEGKDVK